MMLRFIDLLTQHDTAIRKKVKELEKDYPNTPFFLTRCFSLPHVAMTLIYPHAVDWVHFSARTGDNVEKAFEKLVETVVGRQKARDSDGMSLARSRSEGQVIVGCRCTVS